MGYDQGKLLTTLEGHTGSVWAVDFSPDGARVLTGSGNKTARLWDAATGKTVAALEGHTGSVTAVAFSLEPPVALAGDYNVVPTDLDIYATKFWDRDALLQPGSPAASLIPDESVPWNSDQSRAQVAHVKSNTVAPMTAEYWLG